MTRYRIAQVNIGRIRAELTDPIMTGFVSRLDEINALADDSPGFVWRLKTEENNATYLRPFEDERTLLNMSVWESIESLRHFVFQTAHVELLRQRHAWFEKFRGTFAALWWVPADHVPGLDEAKHRIVHLDQNGPTQFAFTFNNVFQPDETYQRAINWSRFRPCTAP
jgi:hypothetical protein